METAFAKGADVRPHSPSSAASKSGSGLVKLVSDLKAQVEALSIGDLVSEVRAHRAEVANLRALQQKLDTMAA